MKEIYEDNKSIILPAIVFLAIFLLFSRTLKNDLVYDDMFRIVANRTIKTTINPVYYFTHPDAGRPLDGIKPDVYRPLSLWLLSLEYKLFGLDQFYYHLLNLLIHSGNAVLFFLLLKKIYGGKIMALLGAFIFGIHPVTTESVAWAVQQNSLWSWFFSFLVLIIAFGETNRILNSMWKKILVLVILSLAAVFSKEQAIILPLIYFLCLFYFKSGIFHELKNIFKSGWKEFGAITFSVILYLLFRAIFLGSFTQQEPWGGGRYSMFLTMIHGFVYYLKLLFWPYPLSINYDSFPIARGITDNNVIFSALMLMFIVSAAVVFVRRLPLFSLGIFWIFTVLAPVSNFIFPTKQIINERFLYFALPGFIISILGVASPIIRKLSKSDFHSALWKSDFIKKHSHIFENIRIFFDGRLYNIYHTILITFTIIILAVFVNFTYVRLEDWQSELTLWKHELKVSPNSWRTQKNYAWALEAENQTRKSIAHYKLSLELAHNSDLALKSVNALAIAYTRINEPRKAIELIFEALKDFLEQDALLYSLGQAYLKNKQYGEAEKVFLHLSEKNNGEDIALFFAVLSEKLGGKKDEKIKNDIAKIKNPRFREQALLLIQAQEKMLKEKWQEAITALVSSLKIAQPPILEPYLWLAESFEKSGEKEKALAVYDLTLSMSPLSIDAMQGVKRLEQRNF